MINQLPAQFFRMRKEWKGMIVWLLMPIILTILIMKSVGAWQATTKIPIGLVVEEETALANQLVNELLENELLQIHFMPLPEALHKLEQHELDSVFVIRKGYEDKILNNRRNQLIDAYSSNQSFAYRAIVEMVTSFVQQDVSRTKAAFVIRDLFNEYGELTDWNYDEIVETSRARQESKALLQTNFTYDRMIVKETDESIPLLQVFGVWSLFSMIATFFLFDWLIKDKRPSMRMRWLYTSFTFRKYALSLLAIYTGGLFIVDLLTAATFSVLFDVVITKELLGALFAFRLTLNLLAFLSANVFAHLFMYYVIACILSLSAVILGGAMIPIDGLMKRWPWVELLSPVHSFLEMAISIEWLGVLSLGLVIWFVKGGRANA